MTVVGLNTVAGKNAELVLEGLEAFLRGDIERALEFVHPDVVTHPAPPLPNSHVFTGHRGMLQAFAEWIAAFDEFEMTSGEVLSLGDKVLIEVHERATGKNSGVEVEGRFWFLYTVDGGKVARLDVFHSQRQGLAALGAKDLPEP
jgi:ketosteroid isomerase-like protein